MPLLGRNSTTASEYSPVTWLKMRSSINSTVENFNNGIGSLESRVLTSARRFKDMGIATSQEIPELTEIDSQTRDFRSAQLRALPEPNGVGDG